MTASVDRALEDITSGREPVTPRALGMIYGSGLFLIRNNEEVME